MINSGIIFYVEYPHSVFDVVSDTMYQGPHMCKIEEDINSLANVCTDVAVTPFTRKGIHIRIAEIGTYDKYVKDKNNRYFKVKKVSEDYVTVYDPTHTYTNRVTVNLTNTVLERWAKPNFAQGGGKPGELINVSNPKGTDILDSMLFAASGFNTSALLGKEPDVALFDGKPIERKKAGTYINEKFSIYDAIKQLAKGNKNVKKEK